MPSERMTSPTLTTLARGSHAGWGSTSLSHTSFALASIGRVLWRRPGSATTFIASGPQTAYAALVDWGI